MSAARGPWSSPAGSRLVLALLTAVLIIGVLSMHHLLSAPPQIAPSAAGAAAVAEGPGAVVHEPGEGTTHHDQDSGQSSMAEDCGGLLAACMALLLTVAGLLRWRRGRSRRVLWLRPHATFVRTGFVGGPFELLTPLERTTVLRC